MDMADAILSVINDEPAAQLHGLLLGQYNLYPADLLITSAAEKTKAQYFCIPRCHNFDS